MGLFVPAGTPPAVVERLAIALKATMDAPAVREPLEKAGAVVAFSPGRASVRYIDDETLNYRRIIEFAKMKVTE